LENKQNLHTHSTWSDGKSTPRELIEEAIARGFSSIGFSEHSYMYFSPSLKQFYISEMEPYRQEIRRLKEEYAGRIDVFCGLEFEFHSRVPLEGFDYMIGSVHYLDFDGKVLGFDRKLEEVQAYIREHFAGDGMAFAEKYFDTLCHLPEKGNFDILGHFDLLTKNNEQGRFIDTSDPKYIRMGLETIHTLQGKIPLFEVNTGAVARGYRTTPYPETWILKLLLEKGFGAVITSDCHDKRFLDCHYEEAVALLREAGFKSQFYLTPRGFEEVAL